MIAYDEGGVTVHLGDCREVLATLPDASIDAVVTDPPYELTTVSRGGSPRTNDPNTPFGRHHLQDKPRPGFMGKLWDGSGISFDPALWAECLRILKPGGHMVAFGGTRTFHRIAVAIEDGGFEIRDTLSWLYGSGFPKSRNLDGEWQGWGTALKPGWEPIILARKPLIGTVAANVTEHGTGALNIDGCRIGESGGTTGSGSSESAANTFGDGLNGWSVSAINAGRWPANVVLDEAAAEMLDAQTATLQGATSRTPSDTKGVTPFAGGNNLTVYGDTGGASRFFYTAKASRVERNAGLDGMPLRTSGMVSNTSGQHITRRDGGAPGPSANHHPTVKPLALMRWLVRLITPPGGVILDPFGGSGTTGVAGYQEGFDVLLIEREPEYVDLIVGRVSYAQKHGRQARLELGDAA